MAITEEKKITADAGSGEELSFQALADKKSDLTSEVRKAGISEGDEAFMDNFSEEMTKKKKSSSQK